MGCGWFIVWICDLMGGWVGLGVGVVRVGMLMEMLMRSRDNSLGSNLIRVTVWVGVAIGYMTLDDGSICPWIV